MVYRGKIYRKADEEGLWEILESRPLPDHYGEWFLARLSGKPVVPVCEQDLVNGGLWIAVQDT